LRLSNFGGGAATTVFAGGIGGVGVSGRCGGRVYGGVVRGALVDYTPCLGLRKLLTVAQVLLPAPATGSQLVSLLKTGSSQPRV